ncbi:UNVERIFIED_CONTAM: hypothetical protein K2H54_012565 [Gekko kuhli]
MSTCVSLLHHHIQKFEETSLSEGSTVDLAIPSDLLEQMPDLAEEMMEPEDCFPECKDESLPRLLFPRPSDVMSESEAYQGHLGAETQHQRSHMGG